MECIECPVRTRCTGAACKYEREEKTMNLVGRESAIMKTVEALRDKFSKSKTSHIELTLKNGKEVIISRNADGYTIYEGCELIVGDVTLRYIAMVLIQMVQMEVW